MRPYYPVAASPDPVAVHATLTYTVTVQNQGPGTATGVTLVDQLPADAVFVSATATQGSCTRTGGGSRNGELTCALGTLNPSSAATVTIVVSPSRAGATLTNVVNVRTSSPDPDSANNTATETTIVLGK